MQKLSSFGQGKKISLKSHLSGYSTQPFSYIHLSKGNIGEKFQSFLSSQLKTIMSYFRFKTKWLVNYMYELFLHNLGKTSDSHALLSTLMCSQRVWTLVQFSFSFCLKLFCTVSPTNTLHSKTFQEVFSCLVLIRPRLYILICRSQLNWDTHHQSPYQCNAL